MTEDSSYSHTSNARFNAPGFVGVPLPGVQVRTAEDGEILIKSPGRLTGYYKRPDLDAESFTADGYFRTGDLGEQRADGLLKITGRAKELFKTTKGQYIAPAPIENQLNAHPMVEQSMVSGVGQAAAYAMVVLAEELRPRLAEPALRSQVQGELERLLKQVNQRQPDYARLRMVVVASAPWSIENGCLTPTMKIKRARIEAAAEPQLERWYASSHAVVWA
jgi:long-subunit acyl-CoA synthetase (AMP-forming)